MLTRIEIDGFKSFEDFSLDLAPFSVVLGANASGKSNLFDALRFLSHLAERDLREAVRDLRGEPDELFRLTAPGSSARRMQFAVEILADSTVSDPWGAEVTLKHTRMRYELTLQKRSDDRGIERPVVAREKAFPILAKDDSWRPCGKKPRKPFRDAHVKSSSRSPWLDTEEEEAGKVSFKISHDGHQGRTRPAVAPYATVLSSITTAEFPHLFALREEMRHWRLLQLDPASLRQTSRTDAPDVLLPDGSNLAAVLARLKTETRDENHPKGIMAELATELAGIIPGVVGLDVVEDEASREYRPLLSLGDGLELPTRLISDGTLRVLALLAALYDPRHRGMLCFEEPENGIHPARLKALIGSLRELVSDPFAPEVDPQEPLVQLLMNSHSPVVLSELWPEKEKGGAVFFADMTTVVDPQEGSKRRRTRIRTLKPEQLHMERSRQYVSPSEVGEYLATVDRGA